MRVATWNLWWRFGPWEARQPAIAEELEAIDADLVLLQEVWSEPGEGDQARMLADRLGLHLARSTVADTGAPYRFGNAVLSRWPIMAEETVVLPDAEGAPSHRSGVVTVIDTPRGRQVVATTHLEWRYNQSPTRQRQLETLVPLLANWQEERAADLPIVFGGDFNAVPEADEVRRLTGLSPGYGSSVFTDCWAATSDEPGHTWTRDNPHSADAQWPRRRLDYVMVSWPRPKPTGNPRRSWLGGRDPLDGVVPSDHYAVVVELDDRTPEELEARD